MCVEKSRFFGIMARCYDAASDLPLGDVFRATMRVRRLG